ncbi:MAG TPA: glycosyltransferase family 2 protein [Gammaproteobacteria bacterium]|nr:glycosyltransferase family 2 protein [Gammaproteobacteria bacterium]
MHDEVMPVVGLTLHFRTPAQTISCLRSLHAEGIRHAVVVDNSEDDGKSLAAMQVHLDELKTSGLTIDVVTSGQNMGFARGVNAGLTRAVAASPSSVLLINSDARLEHGALALLVQGLGNAHVSMPLVRPRPGAPASSLFGYYQRMFALVLRKYQPGCVRYPSGCCLLLRAEMAGSPLFDKDFFFYGEDVMLGLKLRARGVDVVQCPSAVVVHAGSGSAKNGSLFYEYHLNRGHWLLARKLAKNRFEIALFLAARCVTLPLRATVRSMRFRSWVAWKGLIAATFDVVRGRCRSFTPPAP